MVSVVAILVVRNVPLEFWGDVLPCPLRTATGIPCLGCGLTRAAYSFARGDFVNALNANPLGTVMMGGFVLWAGWTTLRGILSLSALRPPLLRSLDVGLQTSGFALRSKARALLPWGVGALLALNYAWVLASHFSSP